MAGSGVTEQAAEAVASDEHRADADVAATPTGAPSSMVGGALSAAPATDPEEGVAGAAAGEETKNGELPPVGAPLGAGGHSESGPTKEPEGGAAGTAARSNGQPQYESAPPIQGFSLAAGILGDRVKGYLPAVVGALVGLVIGLVLAGRRS